jgi:DNA-binding LacI/PurR family transcriptional regulator
MHRAAAEEGYTLSLSIAESEEEAREDIRTAAHARSVDGFVITNPTVSSAYLDDLKSYEIPFVFIGRPVGKAPYVDNDNIEVSRLGVRHLIECGHRRIAFLNGPDRFTFCQDRLLGYRAALEEAGLPYDEDLVWQSEQTEEAAYRVVLEAAQKVKLSAMFAATDTQAVGAIRALRELGSEVPQDVAVVCVNDTELARHFMPPLTTIDLREHWLGYWAAKRLIQKLQGEDGTGYQILIPAELIVRESCGCKSPLQEEVMKGAKCGHQLGLTKIQKQKGG